MFHFKHTTLTLQQLHCTNIEKIIWSHARVYQQTKTGFTSAVMLMCCCALSGWVDLVESFYLRSQTLRRRSVPLEARIVSLWGDHCTWQTGQLKRKYFLWERLIQYIRVCSLLQANVGVTRIRLVSILVQCQLVESEFITIVVR